jgi:UDP-GlcNAc:undecaprenyl-phosphate GlcNAc-1-phosphate transferase
MNISPEFLLNKLLRTLHFPHTQVLLTSWFATLLLLPMTIRLAHKIGAVDRPRGYKAHPEPIPFLGGIVIYLALALGFFSTLGFIRNDLSPHAPSVLQAIVTEPGKHFLAILTGGLLILVVGLMDDFRPIHALVKLIFLTSVAFVLFLNGVALDTFSLPMLNLALSILWIAGVTSATNSLDHMDGACAGTTAVSCTFTFLFFWYGPAPFAPQPWGAYVTLALLGACLGFTRYNLPPARIFLGDNGSMLLGFLLAAITIMGNWSPDPVKSILIPPLLIGVPIFDLVCITLLRYLNGTVSTFYQAVVYCGRDHTTHRLLAYGFYRREAAMILYGLAAAFGAMAHLVYHLPWPLLGPVLGLFVLGLIGLSVWLNKAPMERLTPPSTEAAASPPQGRT